MLLGHVGRGVVDEADQCFGGVPAGGVVNVRRDRCGYQDLHLRAFGEMDGLLGPEYAVFVNSLTVIALPSRLILPRVDAQRETYGVESICAQLPIAPSTYWRHQGPARPIRRGARPARNAMTS